MKVSARVLIIIFLAAFHGTAQSFEVASINPNPESSDTGMHSTPGRFTATASLRALIAVAYDMRELQVVGGPDWVSFQRYDIIATTPAAENQTFVSKDVKQMIRALLTERFKLITHLQKQERPIYTLVVGRRGAKLRPPTLTGSRPGLTGGTNRTAGHLTGVNVPLSLLIDFLTQEVDRPVQDQTGLPGQYDFTLEWSRQDDNTTPSESPYPSIFVALREQLGLALIAKRGRVDVLVIDKAERPTPN